MNLTNRVALVTGASRGIGRAYALKFASSGAQVVVNYVADEERNEREARDVVRECEKSGTKAVAVEANVTDREGCGRMVEEAAAEFGHIDILVNNAGILRDRTLRKMSSDEWDIVIDIHLTGLFNVTKPVASIMTEQGHGRIVNVSSIVGLTGGFGQTNYSSAKAGVIGFTKSLALEVASKGVTVNAVAPGFVDTEMFASVPEDVRETFLKQIPVGRFGQPEDVANLVAFLCSDEAGYITGQVISVNGGAFM